MKRICLLTEQQVVDLFPQAWRELQATPGDHTGEYVYGIVENRNVAQLATWEQQPNDPPQGVLYWHQNLEMWDL